ncbi:MAG: transcription repressor NadR [Lachnospiraceae bacterium]|nr:transcription repressor NadR [Lachnospiraceae bacterium]
MDGDNRRTQILAILEKNTQPLSGTELAAQLGVSRQIIVQDIALLRAVNRNILSTNRGYVLLANEKRDTKLKKIVKVKHTDEQIKDELYTIADCGGQVRDVVVEHPIYGQIAVDLIINSRRDADIFVKQVEENDTKPLNNLTDGVHYHTIEADSEQILEEVEKCLQEKGYLIN